MNYDHLCRSRPEKWTLSKQFGFHGFRHISFSHSFVCRLSKKRSYFDRKSTYNRTMVLRGTWGAVRCILSMWKSILKEVPVLCLSLGVPAASLHEKWNIDEIEAKPLYVSHTSRFTRGNGWRSATKVLFVCYGRETI